MKQRVWVFIICLFGYGIAMATPGPNPAQTQSDPVQLVQTTGNNVIASLEKNKSQLKSNPDIVFSIVKKQILPHVAIVGMARYVVGKQAWQQASPAERKQFINQFTHLVIGTYASAFRHTRMKPSRFIHYAAGLNPSKNACK